MADLTDSVLGTGMISPINASSLSSGINVSGTLPDSTYAQEGNPITVYNSTGTSSPTGSIGNWLDQNFATPVLNAIGLGGIGGGSPTSQTLNAAGLTASSNGSSSEISDLFLRGVIIILGFIFVAVALTMFGNKAAAVVVNETKRSFK